MFCRPASVLAALAAVAVAGAARADDQVPIVGTVVSKRLDLDEQRWTEIERHPDLRELLEDCHHAAVVLQRVHAHPRQDVLAGREVLVERLVHVPQQGESNHWVARAIMGSRR